jgi:hypothetical protein
MGTDYLGDPGVSLYRGIIFKLILKIGRENVDCIRRVQQRVLVNMV